jgi:hypothetical protein
VVARTQVANERAPGAELDARELLYAVALLSRPVPVNRFDFDYNSRMVMVFIEGLRHAPG